MPINFNIEPYYDDFDETKKFLRLLFRPGYPVQARELTQVQSLLQSQISKHAEHMFKQGAMVIPGQISYEDDFKYVKVQSIYNGTDVNLYLNEVIGKELIGNSTGVRAFVVHVEKQTEADPPTLYVRYTTSGVDQNGTPTESKTFRDNEILLCEDLPIPREFTTQVSQSTGIGTGASIENGVYYIDKFFVIADSQKIVLDKYTSSPSYRVGLNIVESVVIPEEEESLLDNAQGTSNFNAPGAHRYKVELILSKRSLDSEDDKNFVELLRIDSGKIIYKTRTTDYSILEQTLARRTFDESGDYVINNFNIDIREHRNNDRGEWKANTPFLIGDVVNYTFAGFEQKYVAKSSGISGSQPPIHSAGEAKDGETGINWIYKEFPFYNRGIYKPEQGGEESKLAVGMEPGKAYVRGYEIEKIGTEYVTIDKSRDFKRAENIQIFTTVGNFVYVTNLFGAPRVDLFESVDLYNRFITSNGSIPSGASKVGTAKVRGLVLYDRDNTRSKDVYQLQLFDIQIIDGKTLDFDVKSFHNSNFTADIKPLLSKLSGSVTSNNSTTITGTGTIFVDELELNDWIYIGNETIRRRVVSITNDNSLVVDSAVTTTGSVIYKLNTQIVEPEYSPLLFPLPYENIRNLRGSDDQINRTSFNVTQVFNTESSSVTGDFCYVTIDSKKLEESFLPSSGFGNYILINSDTGDVVIPNDIEVIQPDLRQVVFEIDGANANAQFIVYAGVRKTGNAAKEKTKTLVTNEIVTVTTQAAAQAKEISLGKSDIFNIISIKMANSFGTINGSNPASTDILDYYEVENGITDSYYGISKLVLKQGYPQPTGSVQVTFEYFDHSPGDYFSVDSYIGSGVKFDFIPRFNGKSLRDVLDFRPRIDSTNNSFDPSLQAVLSDLPQRGTNVEADTSYFLARKEKISIDLRGRFFSTRGIPSLNPTEPESPQAAMLLYKIDLKPYTFSTQSPDISIQVVDNKRYTMRDIGKLEKRIDNLEYYTTLSMLETETQNSKITDENGLDRFKNGFIVDSFSGHGVGDSGSPDYKCSVDLENSELRPFFRMENVNLVEKNSTDGQRVADNYRATGALITLPYEEIRFINQNISSRTENVNPFAIFTFIGRIDLNPSSDDWFEVERRPDLILNVEGNFNTIATLAEKAGVLGTVWNSWQTQWAGAPNASNQVVTGRFGAAWGANLNPVGAVNLSPDAFNAQFGNGPAAAGWARRELTVATTAQQIGQSRSGIKSTVVAQIDRRVIDDKILSTAVIPYIRSRNILFSVNGLKPSTNFWAYFDGAAISKFITPATKISFETVSGFSTKFEVEKNAGSSASENARRLNNDPKNDPQAALNKGDVITGQTSGATAVVVGQEFSEETGARSLYVLNIKGAFQFNEVIVGSISSARGRINSTVVPKSKGSQLTTNFNGSVYGLFDIPNDDAVRFRTGTREFRLHDFNEFIGDTTSYALCDYKAEGILQVKQQTIESVRNGRIVQENLTESRTITQTSERVVSDTGWYDPLAQTFLVQQKGGAFLTSVDLFFASKDKSIPVKIEIREVVNGYPGKKILPFSQVVKNPEDVNISSRRVAVAAFNNRLVSSFDTPTRFTFPSPVYVQDGTEYCIVIISDSNNYNVWVSHLGDKIPGTDRFVSEQPYQGVFFKSQNASTWTPDDYKDLTFIINRAKFNTDVIGRVEFTNDVLPKTRLETNPIQTGNGSSVIRVFHDNHNMPVGSNVQLSGFEIDSLYNGIPSGSLNAVHTIDSVDLDSYTITLTGVDANLSGFTGGVGIYASDNILMTAIQANAQVQNFSQTSIDFDATTTTGQSTDGIEVPYLQNQTPIAVTINDVTPLENPQIICSELNETQKLSGEKSFLLRAVMKSTNDSLSPVIDTHRTSLIAIHNKVNSANPINTNISDLDDVVLATDNTNISFQTDGVYTADNSTKEKFKFASVGRFMRITGSSVSTNNGSVLITEVATDGSYIKFNKVFTSASTGSPIDMVFQNKYVDEVAPTSGSQHSKYLSKRINLANPSTFFTIKFAANVPTSADVDVYYRLNKVGSTSEFDNNPYVKINSDLDILKSNSGIEFNDVTYSAINLPAFDALQVKLVFRTTNSCRVPRIKDLRIVACA
jgi:hypothetical protein